MNKNFILDLTVNTTNPINNKEFLWVSYNINNSTAKKYEKSYWMTLEKNAYLYLVLTDMIFRQVHGSALFLHIYIVGKVLLLLHGNLQILLSNKNNAGLHLQPARCEPILLSGILKMSFQRCRCCLMIQKLTPH